MKIWCVDYAGLSYNISSHLFFDKMEAEDFCESRNHCGNYVKMYQVEDIWGWCARNFDKVVDEVLSSRDSGDDFVFVHGLVEELKEAAAHCGLEQFSADACWSDEADNRVTDTFVLSVAWVSEGKLFHRIYRFEALGTWYNYPTIVERRSKWQK
jgi:hypothetical protein